MALAPPGTGSESSAAKVSERTSHRSVQLKALDATLLKRPYDAWIGADDSELRIVAADAVQRSAQLAQGRCVDVPGCAQINRDAAAAGDERSFAAASEREHRDGLDPCGERDDRDAPMRLVAHGLVFSVGCGHATSGRRSNGVNLVGRPAMGEWISVGNAFLLQTNPTWGATRVWSDANEVDLPPGRYT